MKMNFTRAKSLAACMSAACVMTASWGLGNNAEKVSALSDDGVQTEIGTESHIIDASLFPDPEFRAYVEAKIDKDADGYLTTDEALSVTNIKSEFGSIESLQGVKVFRNLRVLEVRFNEISELDVSGMPNLQWLDCSNNGMTSLNVKNCTDLRTLYCNNNELTSLDLTNDSMISMLYCNNNQLTELDVAPCTELHSLRCGNNALSVLAILDMPKLTNLSCGNNPNMEWLIVCGCEKLSNIDCRESALKEALLFGDANLSVLYCFGNQLEKLPVIGDLDTPYLWNAVNGQVRTMSNGRVTYSATSGSGYIMADADMPIVTDFSELVLSSELPIDHPKLNQIPVATPAPTPTPTATPVPTATPTPVPTATPTPTPVPSNVYTGSMAGKTYRISASNGWTVTKGGNDTYTFTSETNGTVVFQVCNWGYPVFVLNNPGATSFLRNKGIYWGGSRQDLIQARNSSLTSEWYDMGIEIEVN